MAGENPQTTMPPVPREPLIGSNGRMSTQWERWIQQIQRILSFSGGIAWQIVNKAGAKLSDLPERTHAMLQEVLGWVNDSDSAQVRHISNANGKKWEDHVDIVDGNPHGTDWDMLEETASEIPFNVSVPGTTNAEGYLRWNPAERCPEYVTGLGNIEQINKDLWDLGVNKTGVTATDGKVVYASGVQGQRLAFDFADARTADKCNFVGVVTAPILNNVAGPVCSWGVVNDVDTSAWTAGTKLYVAADATGTLTSIAPAAPNYRIWVATVIYQHAVQGSIFVAPRIDHGNGITFYSLDILSQLTAATARIGTTANNTTIEADGTLLFNGDATVWRDENFSGAVSAIGPNAPSLVSWDTSSILIPSFPHNLTKELNLLREIDHAAKQGADIVVHMHLFPSDTNLGTAKFFCEYYIKNDGQPAVTGTLNATKDMSGIAWEELRLDLGTISSALLNQGTQIGLRLYRLSTDPGTYTHPVAVSTWGYHYQLDTVGSRQITAK